MVRLDGRFLLLALAAVAVAAGPAPAARAADPEPGAHDATMHHRFDDAEQWSKVFDDPGRDAWQKPSIVVRVVGVYDGQVAADLGCGTGYFTRYLASAVGKTGTVYAVDIEPGMLEHIRDGEDFQAFGNIETVLAAPDDPKLPDGAVDTILIVDTWHHIDDRMHYLPRLAKALKPGGRVAVIDFHEGDLPVGPPAGHKLSRDQVVAEFEQAGWQLVTESVALPYQYLLVFLPPGTVPPSSPN